MVIYKATNECTGEVIEGGARDIAKALGITVKTVYDVVHAGLNVRTHWKVARIKADGEEKGYHFNPALLAEWDRVTEPFKKASQRAKEKAGGL